jgi:hypothetical protein
MRAHLLARCRRGSVHGARFVQDTQLRSPRLSIVSRGLGASGRTVAFLLACANWRGIPKRPDPGEEIACSATRSAEVRG